MAAHPSFPPAELESVCRVLAETASGLTGSGIGHLLAQLGIADPTPGLNKWKRSLSARRQSSVISVHSDGLTVFAQLVAKVFGSLGPSRNLSDPTRGRTPVPGRCFSPTALDSRSTEARAGGGVSCFSPRNSRSSGGVGARPSGSSRDGTGSRKHYPSKWPTQTGRHTPSPPR